MWTLLRLFSQTKLCKHIQQSTIRLRSVVGVADPASSIASSSVSDSQHAAIPLRSVAGVSPTPYSRKAAIRKSEEPNAPPIKKPTKRESTVKEALEVFSLLKKKGDGRFKRPDVNTYVAIIRMLCYWGMQTKLDSLLLEIIQSKRKHLGFDALDLLDALLIRSQDFKEGATDPSNDWLARALDAMAKAYVNAGQFDEAITLFTTPCGCGACTKPLLMACNLLMNRLVDCGQPYLARDVYHKLQKRLCLTPNICTYGIVIKAYSIMKHGPEKAANLYWKAEKATGLAAPDQFSFICSCYLEGLCLYGMPATRRSALPRFAYKVLKRHLCELLRGNAAIDAYPYKVLLRVLVDEDKLLEAECILEEMEEHGLKPDAYCYSELIHGYCKTGRITRALLFYSEMMCKNIKTNYVIVGNILICLLEKRKNQELSDDEVITILNEMKNNGMIPDHMSKYTQWGSFSASEVEEEMKGRRMKLNDDIFKIVARG